MLDRSRKGSPIFAVSVYKNDAGICWGRPERKSDRLAGMEPDSLTTYWIC